MHPLHNRATGVLNDQRQDLNKYWDPFTGLDVCLQGFISSQALSPLCWECGVMMIMMSINIIITTWYLLPSLNSLLWHVISFLLSQNLGWGTLILSYHISLFPDGRTVSSKARQPSAERLRYLETKIAEIEEAHCCSICMERRRNVAFLCGHGACVICAQTLKTCHMCRKPISKKINLY